MAMIKLVYAESPANVIECFEAESIPAVGSQVTVNRGIAYGVLWVQHQYGLATFGDVDKAISESVVVGVAQLSGVPIPIRIHNSPWFQS